jgi:predicted metal-dependent HD superfamily phosphohydrolase
MSTENNIVAKAQSYVEQLFKEKLSKDLTYHNYEHTERVAKVAEEIGKHSNLNEDDLEVLSLAAWFHDTGFINDYENHEEESQKIASAFLKSENVPDEKIERVIVSILATKKDQLPSNEIEEILCDADLHHISQNGYFKIADSLRKEWEIYFHTVHTDMEWYESCLDFVLKSKFYTPYGKEVLEKGKDKVLKDLKKNMKKHQANLDLSMEKELGVSPADLKELKKKLLKVEGRPERGIETMFRLTSTNHLTLSGMADTKANILISVNSIILSFLIGSLMQKLDNNPQLIIPTYVMLIVNLGSIISAILSTRPNITSGKFTREDIEQNKTNLLFFGNFHQMQRSDYQWGMHRLMDDGKYLYSSLIDDIFFLGVVLGRKYKYLRISYNIFMYGLVTAVIVFMVSNAYYRNFM